MEIDERKLVIGLGLVFLLGVLFSVANGYYTKTTGQQFSFLIYALVLAALALGSGIVLLFQSRINRMQLKSLLKILPREERIVLQILVGRKELEQKHLVVLSGLSKVQVSRVLKKLEERGIVERKPSGYTNLVILKL